MATSASVVPDPPEVLRVRALGALVVEGVDLRLVRSRKARTALKVLVAARGRPVSVDRLVECLWPDGVLPRDPEREVAVNLSRVRTVLGRDRVLRVEAGYRIEVDWLDLAVLDELAAEAHRRSDAGEHAAARTVAAAALELVRGPLLADAGDSPWLDLERAAVDRTVADLRHLAADTALTVGDPGTAAALAEASLAADPYDEVAARILMQAHRVAGRPGSALAAYARVRDRLRDDLGANPSAATDDLHLAILVENDEPAARADTPAEPPPRPAPAVDLAGREPELAMLADALASAADALEVVVVVGDPGAGKTRLIETFAARAREGGATAIVGRCDELGRGLPLQPVADALAGLLHAAGPGGRSEILAGDAAVLGPLLGLADAPTTTLALGPSSTPEAQQALVFAALLRVVDRLGPTGPAVVVIDDAHLAGPSTLEWLRFCVRRRTEARGLVVVTARVRDSAPLVGTRRIELGPLDLDAVRTIVGADRADSLLRRSGGNALLLVELAGAVDGTVPATVRESVDDRLRAAGPTGAETIRTAAVLGPEVDLDLLATVLERPPLDLLRDLEGAVDHRFLDERGDRFEFCHALVREALVATSSATRQSLVHRRAALALAERPACDPLVLAHHAGLGGEPALAARALASAAEVAVARSDLDEAERLLDAAIAADPTADRLLERGRVRIARSDFAGADADAVAAGAAGRRAEALALRAWVARHRHEMGTAIALGREGAAMADDDRTRASCLLVVALAQRGLGDLRGAEAELDEVLALAGPDGAGVRGWSGTVLVHQGRAAEGLALLEPAVGAEADMVHGFWVEHVLQMAAHGHALVGHATRALDLLDRLTAESVRRGSAVRYQGLDDNYRAWILMNLGDPAAPELNLRAREVATMPEMAVQATLDLAAGRYHVGDLAGAAELVAGALHDGLPSSFSNRWRCEQRASLLRSLVSLADDDAEQAHRVAGALRLEVVERGDQRYVALATVVDERARHRLGLPVDHDELDRTLRGLGRVAGLEAWWLTAETAATFGSEAWWALADERVAALADQAGTRRALLVAAATTRWAGLGRR